MTRLERLVDWLRRLVGLPTAVQVRRLAYEAERARALDAASSYHWPLTRITELEIQAHYRAEVRKIDPSVALRQVVDETIRKQNRGF